MSTSPIQFAGPTLPAAPAPPARPAIGSAGGASFASTLKSAMGGSAAAVATTAAAAPAATAATSAVTGGTSATLDGATGTTTAAAGTGALAKPATPGSYPHLNGDLDAHPELLAKLDALAAKRGETFHLTSGLRTHEEQTRLWNNRGNNPYPVARPGSSRHESGRAADVTIGGRAIQDVIPAAELRAAGLAPLAGDAVHVELP